jgi:hypothetical protein
MNRIAITPLVALVSVALFAAACTGSHSTADIEDAKSAGNPVVQGIVDYKATHGRYPASFQEAGITPAKTKFGAFQYEHHVAANDEYFVVRVGDYSKNGFVLFWNSGMSPPGWVMEE